MPDRIKPPSPEREGIKEITLTAEVLKENKFAPTDVGIAVLRKFGLDVTLSVRGEDMCIQVTDEKGTIVAEEYTKKP